MRIRVHKSRESKSAFTLVEVLMSLAVIGLVFGGIIFANIQSTRIAEWSGYSLAAQALAIQKLEEARSAKWDVLDTPVVDEITNLPSISWNTLDLPISGTNVVRATNYITVTTVPIANNPVVNVHMVRVDTVWPFQRQGQTVYFTNTVANYFAPDR